LSGKPVDRQYIGGGLLRFPCLDPSFGLMDNHNEKWKKPRQNKTKMEKPY
jgi:hypothetical protein